MAHLVVTLAPATAGIRVAVHLDGVAVDAGDPLAQLPVSIAGAPTLQLVDGAVAATDQRGHLPLVAGMLDDDDGDLLQVWSATRATVGRVSLTYLAEPSGRRTAGRDSAAGAPRRGWRGSRGL